MIFFFKESGFVSFCASNRYFVLVFLEKRNKESSETQRIEGEKLKEISKRAKGNEQQGYYSYSAVLSGNSRIPA